MQRNSCTGTLGFSVRVAKKALRPGSQDDQQGRRMNMLTMRASPSADAEERPMRTTVTRASAAAQRSDRWGRGRKRGGVVRMGCHSTALC